MIPGKTFFLNRGERPLFRRYHPSGGLRDYQGNYDSLIIPMAPLDVWTPDNLPGGEAFDAWVAERQAESEHDIYFVHGWINPTHLKVKGKHVTNDNADPYHPAFSYFLIPKDYKLQLDRGQP